MQRVDEVPGRASLTAVNESRHTKEDFRSGVELLVVVYASSSAGRSLMWWVGEEGWCGRIVWWVGVVENTDDGRAGG